MMHEVDQQQAKSKELALIEQTKPQIEDYSAGRVISEILNDPKVRQES